MVVVTSCVRGADVYIPTAPTGGTNVVLAQLDKLVDPLEKTLTAKLKSDAVKQEVSCCYVTAHNPQAIGPTTG